MTQQSLLAHVVSNFASRRWEDVATEAVRYLLARPRAERAMIDALAPAGVTVPAGLRWRTQALDPDDPSRPDLVGDDPRGRHVIVVEAKFWAQLTNNQPGTYLDRQARQFKGDTSPTALVVLCPERRLPVLTAELADRLSEKPVAAGGLIVIPDHRSTVVLLSWKQLLSALEVALTAADDPAGQADLAQLTGLCDRADTEAMLPLGPEDVDSENGRRHAQFCDVVDSVTDHLKRDGVVDTKSLKATATKNWYGRYVRASSGQVFRISVNTFRWAQHYPSPWWIRFWSPNAQVTLVLQQLHADGVLPFLEIDESGTATAALAPPLHVERDRVVSQLADQVRRVCDLLPRTQAEAPPEALEGGPEPQD